VGSQRLTAAACAWQGALVGLGHADGTAWHGAIEGAAVNWSDVLEEARRLRLASFLHLGLTAAPGIRAKVPSSVTEALRRAAYASTVRATQLERLCASIATDATLAGIPVLVLKGPALVSLVYPEAAPRPMDDVDLLVAREDRERLACILRARGYRNDLRGEEDFLDPSRCFSVDVNAGLVNTTRIPARGALWPVTFEELWARSQVCTLSGVPVRTLGPLDTILHVALHAVHHHGLGGALWMLDLLACLRQWPHALDSNLILPPPLRRSLWYCLEVLSAFVQDPAPEVRAALQPRWLFPGEGWILTARKERELPEEIRYTFTLACLPNWRAKSTFLRQVAFPRPGVHTDGFGDAGGSAPGLGEHWRSALRFGWNGLRVVLAGRARPGQRSAGATDSLGRRETSR